MALVDRMVQRRGSPGRFVAAAVVVFLVAILVARLMLWGPAGVQVFLVLLPVILLALTALLGFARAALLVVLFAAASWLLRWLLTGPNGAWVVLVVLPAVACALLVAWKTLRPRRAASVEDGADLGGSLVDSPEGPAAEGPGRNG